MILLHQSIGGTGDGGVNTHSSSVCNSTTQAGFTGPEFTPQEHQRPRFEHGAKFCTKTSGLFCTVAEEGTQYQASAPRLGLPMLRIISKRPTTPISLSCSTTGIKCTLC